MHVIIETSATYQPALSEAACSKKTAPFNYQPTSVATKLQTFTRNLEHRGCCKPLTVAVTQLGLSFGPRQLDKLLLIAGYTVVADSN